MVEYSKEGFIIPGILNLNPKRKRYFPALSEIKFEFIFNFFLTFKFDETIASVFSLYLFEFDSFKKAAHFCDEYRVKLISLIIISIKVDNSI